MNAELEILGQLLPKLDAYLKTTKSPSIQEFESYLTQKHKHKENLSNEHSAVSMMDKHADLDASISFHINRLGKYAKYYIKEAFKEVELIGGDDFGFLATVVEVGSIKKTDLIKFNVHEVPSGMEIIKRLTKNGLFQEKVDINDRRTKVVSATEKGIEVFLKATSVLPMVGALVSAKLNEVEKNNLLILLKKLDQFHETVYQNEKKYDLDLLSEKYLSDK